MNGRKYFDPLILRDDVKRLRQLGVGFAYQAIPMEPRRQAQAQITQSEHARAYIRFLLERLERLGEAEFLFLQSAALERSFAGNVYARKADSCDCQIREVMQALWTEVHELKSA